MNALLMGYYGARNLGDEMMLVCLRRWLEAQNVQVTVLSEGAQDIRDRHGLPALDNLPLLGQWAWRDAWLRGKAFSLLASLARHDALVVGGGDLIRDDRGWRNFLFSVEKIVAAILLRRPVYLVNIGIGAPSTRYGRPVLRWILRRCTRIIARDERTFRLCTELGAGAVTHFAPDIVMSLPQLLEAAAPPADPRRKYALVCLRTHANDFQQFAWTDERIRHLASALDHLSQRHDLDIEFLPFQAFGPAQDDNHIHHEVASAMPAGSRVTVRPWSDDIPGVMRAVGGAACVIAMRLHAAVLACSLERPCVLMPYDHKVVEFGRQMGLRETITSATLDRPDELRRTLDSALTRPPVTGRLSAGAWSALSLSGRAGDLGDVGEPLMVI